MQSKEFHTLTLAEYFAKVYCLERALKPESIRQVRMSIRAFDRWHGRAAHLEELADELVNQWILASGEQWAPKTLRRRRCDIIGLWRYANETRHVTTMPERVRPVKVPKRVPQAWSRDEVRAILRACRLLTDYFPTGVQRGKFWSAFVRTGYDTALRLSDLLALKKSRIGEAGKLVVLQEKTQVEHVCRLRDTTIAAIADTYPPDRELVFPWSYSREQFWYHWRKLLESAGLPSGRTEGPQKLRRTSASHLEAVAPGAATAHLGHKTPGMAKAHYIDPRIANKDLPMPPTID